MNRAKSIPTSIDTRPKTQGDGLDEDALGVDSSSTQASKVILNTGHGQENPSFTQSQNKLIERLVQELDRKSEALQKLGNDVLLLRKHATTQETTIKQLQTSLSDSDLKTKRLINSFDLDIIPSEEIKRRYALLADKLESALEKLSVANDKLHILDDAMVDKERVEMENKALRQAHTAQQTLVLDLQDSLQKAQKFKGVIQKQEQVIAQLELKLAGRDSFGVFSSTSHPAADLGSLESFREPLGKVSIEEHTSPSKHHHSISSIATSVDLDEKMKEFRMSHIARQTPLPPSVSASQRQSHAVVHTEKEVEYLEQEIKRLTEDRDHLRSKITNLMKENGSLHERVTILESEKRNPSTDTKHRDSIKGEIPMEMFKLLMRAEAAEIKVKALEEQLIESSKAFGREIRELKASRR